MPRRSESVLRVFPQKRKGRVGAASNREEPFAMPRRSESVLRVFPQKTSFWKEAWEPVHIFRNLRVASSIPADGSRKNDHSRSALRQNSGLKQITSSTAMACTPTEPTC